MGHIGRVHARQIIENGSTRLVACCDTAAVTGLGQEFGTIPFFPRIDQMLASGLPIDVVNICTPNNLHVVHTLAALDRGCHVVCEKPLTLNTRDALAIKQKALETGKRVFCVVQNRFAPASVWLKNIMASGSLGRLFFVQVHCFWNRDERYYTPGSWHGTMADGGTLFTQFSHFIDMIYWLFGDITNVSGRFFDFNHHETTCFEDTGFVNFDFTSGGTCTFHYSTSIWGKNLESCMIVVGEKGSLKISGQYMDKVEYCHIDGQDTYPQRPTSPLSNHALVIQNIVEVLCQGLPARIPLDDGIKVVEIIEKIYAVRDGFTLPASLLP
jgi:predicted dehydrogenase